MGGGGSLALRETRRNPQGTSQPCDSRASADGEGRTDAEAFSNSRSPTTNSGEFLLDPVQRVGLRKYMVSVEHNEATEMNI